jgi:hypothetical protein
VLRLARAAVLLALAVPFAAGCGSGGGTPAERGPSELVRTDRRPALPPGWRRVVNQRAGFNLALPPGWEARSREGSTLLRAFDGTLAGSVTSDRSEQGLSFPPALYARRAALRLAGFRHLRVERARRVVDVRYPTQSAAATGILRRGGLRQAIVVFALRPRRGATYSLVFFRSARVPASRYARLLELMVRSFRVQAPEL